MLRFKSAAQIAIIALTAGFGLTACADDQFTSVAASDPTERALGGDVLSSHAYHLTVGDHLRVTIFGSTPVTGEYTVDNTGTVSLPPLPPLTVQGMSASDAGSAIAKSYTQAGLFRDPRVTVDIISFGPFYVLGEVNKAGEFPYHPGMSLFAAVASAGGYTYRANPQHVYIRKAHEAVETEYELTSDIAILPGDVIRVPELHL